MTLDTLADIHIKPQAWRAAGMAPNTFMPTLAACDVPTLRTFAAMTVTTNEGRVFVARAAGMLAYLKARAADTDAHYESQELEAEKHHARYD